MAGFSAKVHMEPGGDRQTVEPGGSVKLGDVIFTVDADGNVIVTGLPTSEPAAVGALWSNNGVLTVSDGP
ncbi:hypothetical protein [Mesorhizobium marinum]|uniref:Uncharacterized protein n=1 Tax=Mesorhizobium marinum TaxID=3228790 RepID=A0ABV3R756_9HYPH